MDIKEFLIPVSSGQMQDDVFAIPLFIGIKIVVAEGVKTGTEAEYRKMLAQYKSESQKFKNETVAGNPGKWLTIFLDIS